MRVMAILGGLFLSSLVFGQPNKNIGKGYYDVRIVDVTNVQKITQYFPEGQGYVSATFELDSEIPNNVGSLVAKGSTGEPVFIFLNTRGNFNQPTSKIEVAIRLSTDWRVLKGSRVHIYMHSCPPEIWYNSPDLCVIPAPFP
jgi:hypothetical protein